MQAPFEDILPGVIWSRLSTDLVAATGAAVELLIERLEQPVPPPADASEVRQRFAELHAQFAALAEWEQTLPRPDPTQPEVPVPLRIWQEPQVVKVASSFSMPPAANWCGFPMSVAFDRLLLSQNHADAEYLLTRNLVLNFWPLAEQAGQALPLALQDAPVLFSRTHQNRFPQRIPAASLNPDPVGRWVRFVLNSLRANEPGTNLVRVEFLDSPTATTWPPVYGYANFPGGIFAASARAIEVSGLFPSADGGTLPASGTGENNAPTSEVAERPAKNRQKRSTNKGDAQAKLLAALTKHHGYSDEGCAISSPVGNNALARAAEVDRASATRFFKEQFGGHAKYKVICRDSVKLSMYLKQLNGGYSPDALFGRKPPKERNRDDD